MATTKNAVTFTSSRRGKKWLDGTMVRQFEQAMRANEQDAAREATQVSRATYTSKLGPRPLIAARPGRQTTGGQFASDITWKVTSGGGGRVNTIAADRARLPWYWLINEIGTGQKAEILNIGAEVTVKTQVGRYISANLVWASGGRAQSASVARRGLDQLMFASQVGDLNGVRQRRMRIRREIKGKHYLRDGGAAGFDMLRKKSLSDAERIFQ